MTAKPAIIIQNVRFDPDGDIQVSYVIPSQDTKEVGLAHLHTLLIPQGFDYDDEIQAVLDAADYLVRDVLEDWDNLQSPPDPT